MVTSKCTRCDFDLQCQCPERPATNKPLEITPAFCFGCYSLSFVVALVFTFFMIIPNCNIHGCYLEIFANSVSLTNANVSNADWRIDFLTKSPIFGCKSTIHTMKLRLLRGDEVISESSPSLDFFGQFITSDIEDGSVTSVAFKNVATPGVIGSVFWDFRVEIVSRMKRDDIDGDGFLMVFCGGFPVKFMADANGNMAGSLLGNMRRCDNFFRDKLESFLTIA